MPRLRVAVVGALLAALLLPSTVPAQVSSSTSCDYHTAQNVPLGTSSAVLTRYRCHAVFAKGDLTYRVDRLDSSLYDPFATSGLQEGPAVVMQSERWDYLGGSSEVTHEVSVRHLGLWLSAGYGSYRDGGATACELFARDGGATEATTPKLPACVPHGALLP